jgi:hypothetical protein
MDKLTLLTAFILFLSNLAILAGMVRPRWVIRWGNTRSRGRVLLYYGGAVLICFVTIGIMGQPAKENSPAPVVEQPKVAEPAESAAKAKAEAAEQEAKAKAEAAKPKVASQAKPLSTEERIKAVLAKASERIKDVEVIKRINGSFLAQFTLKDEDAWSGSSYVQDSLLQTKNIMRALAEDGVLSSLEVINVRVDARMQDKYGNKSADMLYRASFKGAEISRVNWQNADHFLVANLADTVMAPPAGRAALADFCKDNLDDAKAFCRTADRN